MKYYPTLTLILLVNTLLSSCTSFTEVAAPQTQITSSAVFEEKSSANAALSDIYSRIREEGVVTGTNTGGTVLLANYSDDLLFYGTNVNIEQFAKHSLLPSNTYINTLWRNTYSPIYATNAFLDGMRASVNITGEDRDRFMGEALFIRAFLHFYLVNMFGEIPYIKTTDYAFNSTVSKTTVAEVYHQILDDLTQARALIPDTYPTAEPVRPNKAVVTALLARVYLYTQDWQNAADNASTVINNTKYSWQNDPSAEFLKTNPAILWALHPDSRCKKLCIYFWSSLSFHFVCRLDECL
jgi:starch-binding outer membrane protein, SusD/RagB family